MRLFLDSSVLLAATGSHTGASRAIFDLVPRQGWELITAEYCVAEVEVNLHKLPVTDAGTWPRLRDSLAVLADVWTDPRPFLLTAGKDRPVLFAALAHAADALVTLDQADFDLLLNSQVYGLWVLKPADFLRQERAAGRLS